MRLYEIVACRAELKQNLVAIKKEYQKKVKLAQDKIDELDRLENIHEEGLNLQFIQIAEKILTVQGNPYGKTSHVTKFGNPTIAEAAILDIANGCPKLRKEYFGNKRYSGFYQRCDAPYGMGPRHGSIFDRVGLQDRRKVLSSDEKDACIYYLKNYAKVAEASAVQA